MNSRLEGVSAPVSEQLPVVISKDQVHLCKKEKIQTWRSFGKQRLAIGLGWSVESSCPSKNKLEEDTV